MKENVFKKDEKIKMFKFHLDLGGNKGEYKVKLLINLKTMDRKQVPLYILK
jgi:hypothetical protein